MEMHFKCEEIFRKLSAYIDEEIDSFMKEIMDRHIKECERCLSLLRTLEKTINFSRSMHRKRRVPKSVINRIYYEIRIRYRG